jgi:hypothetical protein
MRPRSSWFLLGMFALLAANQAASAQDKKVYRPVAAEKLEKILADLDFKFQKTPGKKEGIVFYDFKRGDFTLRLHNYGGQDLWIECYFSDKWSLEDLNRWNSRSKFTRAVLVDTKEKSTISLEAQLDCFSGTTDAIIRQYIIRFDQEVKDFAKFMTK